MIRSPGRWLLFATVFTVTLILMLQQTETGPTENSLPSNPSPLIRTTLDVELPPPTPISANNPSHASDASRPPYSVLSPTKPMHRNVDVQNVLGKQMLQGTLAFGTGAPLRSQAIQVELILYRPKPDVIYTGTILTDDRGRFSIPIGDDYLTTTSISLHIIATHEAYRTDLVSTTHFPQAPQGDVLELGNVILFDAYADEE